MKSNAHKIALFVGLTAVILMMAGCGEYQTILKSKDPDLKYQKALTYFNDKQYVKAQSLLDEVTAYYRGTDRSQDVLIYLSRSYMGQKDYISAAEYYQAYIRTYPKGRYIIEARFQVGHCYYLDAPDPKLDQTDTKKAIEFFTQFVELYPESPYAAQAYQEMSELYDKLAYKEYLNAKLYYNLGSYLGNNYLSAEIVAKTHSRIILPTNTKRNSAGLSFKPNTNSSSTRSIASVLSAHVIRRTNTIASSQSILTPSTKQQQSVSIRISRRYYKNNRIII